MHTYTHGTRSMLTECLQCCITAPPSDYSLGQPVWLDAALVNKLVLCAWLSSGALEIWRLQLRWRWSMKMFSLHSLRGSTVFKKPTKWNSGIRVNLRDAVWRRLYILSVYEILYVCLKSQRFIICVCSKSRGENCRPTLRLYVSSAPRSKPTSEHNYTDDLDCTVHLILKLSKRLTNSWRS